jgi:hypothetical protein
LIVIKTADRGQEVLLREAREDETEEELLSDDDLDELLAESEWESRGGSTSKSFNHTSLCIGSIYLKGNESVSESERPFLRFLFATAQHLWNQSNSR